jgi:hypothetical protein
MRRVAMERAGAGTAVGASLFATLGLALATRDGPGIVGYVSESGATGAPHAPLYRASLLLFVVAAGAAALALRRAAGLAALALALAAPCLLVSAAARCTPGCPLPPFQHPTASDLIHAGASIAAVGLCALAMLAAAVRSADPAVRVVSRWSTMVTFPVLAAMAVGLLAVGHGTFTGLVERLCLAGCLGWLVVACALRARPRTGVTGSGTGALR